MNRSFGLLFRYISGSNEDAKKIAMTSPVLMGGAEATMAFILPKSDEADPPTPQGDVRITVLPAGRFAAYRFSSNGRTPEDDGRAASELLTILSQRGLRPEGQPLIAYYDPPWIPRFLRRHEVLMRLADSAP
jgi:hypothetical protein